MAFDKTEWRFKINRNGKIKKCKETGVLTLVQI